MAERQFRLTNSFKRDVKKQYLALVSKEWAEIFTCLINDMPLAEKYCDHALTNNWKGFRDCHVKPDLVLVYKIVDDVIEFHHLKTHSELF